MGSKLRAGGSKASYYKIFDYILKLREGTGVWLKHVDGHISLFKYPSVSTAMLTKF